MALVGWLVGWSSGSGSGSGSSGGSGGDGSMMMIGGGGTQLSADEEVSSARFIVRARARVGTHSLLAVRTYVK
jgi:hypothetical protein